MDFTKYNNESSKFKKKLPKDCEYKKLSELQDGETYPIIGGFISHKGNFGDHPVLALAAGFYADLPKHMTKIVKDILADGEAVEAINEGHCGIETYKYEKDGKTYTSCNFVNI